MTPYHGVLSRAIEAVFRQRTGIAVALLALAAAAGPSAARSADDTRAVQPASLVYASFGSVEIGVDAPTVSPKSTDLFSRIGREQEAYANCLGEDAACPSEVRSWREGIDRLHGLAGLELLTSVNAAVNRRITYRDDLAAYGKIDYWATPMESLTGYGDCEDYAVVKYLSLIELGIPHDRMRIVILKDSARNIGHAVLAVTLEGGTYILDNVIARPTPDSALAHYQPIYSFNMDDQWLNVAVRPRTRQMAASDIDRSPVAVIPPAARNQIAAAGLQTDTKAD